MTDLASGLAMPAQQEQRDALDVLIRTALFEHHPGGGLNPELPIMLGALGDNDIHLARMLMMFAEAACAKRPEQWRALLTERRSHHGQYN